MIGTSLQASHEPTAPPSLYLSEEYVPEADPRTVDRGQRLLKDLYDKCLLVIDQNASAVLAREDVEDLDFGTMKEVLDRPGLNVVNELFVFSVLQRSVMPLKSN